MVAEAAVVGEPTLVREKRATNFTDEQRACLDKCAECSPFTSDEEYAGRQSKLSLSYVHVIVIPWFVLL